MSSPTGEHDLFHMPSDAVWWFEAFWFSFFVPERDLMVYVYPWFRPVQGLAGGGVLAWDGGACEPWNIVHHDYAWHLPCSDPATLVSGNLLSLPQGVTIEILESDRRYRVVYAQPLLSFEIVFTAISAPNVVSRAVSDTQLFAGRIDQCGRVQGEMVLRGERIAIDCLSMRDRSWGVRGATNPGMHIGYFHATLSDRDAFLAVSNHAEFGDAGAPVTNGYLLREGVQAPLVSGTVTLERDAAGKPISCLIDAVDESGRPLRAEGRARTWFAYQPYPGMFNWSSLADWSIGGQSYVGELQDTWYPDDWRLFKEGLRR